MLRQLVFLLLCFGFAIHVNALDITVSDASEIQNAINQVSASGGGTVQLAAGTYIISASIKMKSNVTFQGVGTATRIELPTTATYPMIIDDGTEPCVNMTIRNMLLDGNIPESKVSHDPDYTTDPQNPCLGILIDAFNEETYHTNVIIENVEIHNTVDACHLKGVKGGYMDNVYFHHNGIFFWPGHNAYLRRCIDYTVKNSRIEDSYNGSGVNCSWSKNLLFSNCVVLRSEGRGIRNAASEGFVVHDCIIADCGDAGIIANTEGGVSTSGVDFRRNCVSGCKTGITGGTSGVAYNNNSFSNSTNYSLGGSVLQSGNTSTSGQSCAEGIGAWNPISVSAHVVSENTKQIRLNISHNIAENETYEGFTIEVGKTPLVIESIALLNPTTIVLNLPNNISTDDTLTLSYSESGNLQTEAGEALIGFDNMQVDNFDALSFELETASMAESGAFVSFKLNASIGTIHNPASTFTFEINNEIINAERAIVGDSIIQIYPSAKIYQGDVVKASYSPNAFIKVVSTNSSELQPFSDVLLENMSTLVLPTIPGKIEAEDYDTQFGVRLENCDEGGQNLAYIETNDWAEYNVRVSTDTTYKATFRLAARAAGGEITVYVDGSQKGVVTVPNTGAWQSYQSSSVDMKLTKGSHTIKLVFKESFNLNWMSFEETTPGNEADSYLKIEAENFDGNSGTSVEACSDIGGGEDVGSIRSGNWLMYRNVDLSDVVRIEMRLATNRTGSSVQVRLGSVSGTLIATLAVPNTGGFQTWETADVDIEPVDGIHDVYLVFKSTGSWVGNINWLQFFSTTKTTPLIHTVHQSMSVYPNPVSDQLTITNASGAIVEIFNLHGKLMTKQSVDSNKHLVFTHNLASGIYFVKVSSDNQSFTSFKIIKQ